MINLQTPQTSPIIGRESEMAVNRAGGVTFTVTDWDLLDRFLILGDVNPRYTVKEQNDGPSDFSKNDAILKLIESDGERVINRVVDISLQGRAPSNDPALYVLALCASAESNDTRRAALSALPKVARIGTHLFHFAAYVDKMRGWGRTLRKSIGNWYLDKQVDKLALQLIKYQQRDGWSNRDLLRLSHPKTQDLSINSMFKWVIDGSVTDNLHPQILAFEAAKSVQTDDDLIALITDHNLPREAIPTTFLNSVAVWDALLAGMLPEATMRNLGKMTNVGLLSNDGGATTHIVNMLTDEAIIRKARLHPLAILTALKVYEQGHGAKGKLTWTPIKKIINALDAAFYTSFKNVDPTGKNYLIGVDCSGSMSSLFGNSQVMSSRDVAAAMSLVIANTEPNSTIMGFASGSSDWTSKTSKRGWSRGSGLRELNIKPTMRLDEVLRKVSLTDWGGTDCSLPFQYASAVDNNVDVFVVITDNDTWAGEIQPVEALRNYRQKSGRWAKSIVVATEATNFTIADPKDGGMFDVVGFDTHVPQLISDFIRG